MEEYFGVYFLVCFGFIFLYKIIYLILEFEEKKKIWNLFKTIIPNNNGKYIYTINNPNYKKDKKYLDYQYQICREYYLDNELINYNKFNINSINKAHCSLIQKILKNQDPQCLIIQNMSKPRDYFELVASLLVNRSDYGIIILGEGEGFFKKCEYQVTNILQQGSHIFYDKKNKKKEIYVRSKQVWGEKIYYWNGLIDNDEELDLEFDFCEKIITKYFEINLFHIIGNNDESYFDINYGVSIVKNTLELDERLLFYIGQLYLK